jgi:hypothetical protein
VRVEHEMLERRRSVQAVTSRGSTSSLVQTGRPCSTDLREKIPTPSSTSSSTSATADM